MRPWETANALPRRLPRCIRTVVTGLRPKPWPRRPACFRHQAGGDAYDLLVKLAYTFSDRKEAAADALYRAILIASGRGDAQGARTLQTKLESEQPDSPWTVKRKENP